MSPSGEALCELTKKHAMPWWFLLFSNSAVKVFFSRHSKSTKQASKLALQLPWTQSINGLIFILLAHWGFSVLACSQTGYCCRQPILLWLWLRIYIKIYTSLYKSKGTCTWCPPRATGYKLQDLIRNVWTLLHSNHIHSNGLEMYHNVN